MYSKLIKFVVLLSFSVCCGFSGRVVYSCFFSLAAQGKDPRHILGVRSGIAFPWSLSLHITQTCDCKFFLLLREIRGNCNEGLTGTQRGKFHSIGRTRSQGEIVTSQCGTRV